MSFWQIIDPFVEVEIIGLPVDCCKEQTRVVDDNGGSPFSHEMAIVFKWCISISQTQCAWHTEENDVKTDVGLEWKQQNKLYKEIQYI